MVERHAGRAIVVVVLIAGLVGLAVTSMRDPSSPADPEARTFHVAAVGDVAYPERPDADRAVADAIGRLEPPVAALLTLGDHQYPEGSLSSFLSDYDRSFGRFNDVVRPIVGNHEWHTPGAAGYVTYFEDHAPSFPGEQRCTWDGDCAFRYAWTRHGWSFYAVDDLHTDEGFDAEWIEATASWLRRRLADDPNACQVVYTHAPRFSDGYHGDAPEIEPIWRASVDGGVELFLAGHEHSYQRFDVEGVTQVVAGTGGADQRGFDDEIQPTSRAEIAGVDGFVALALGDATLPETDEPMITVRFIDADGTVRDEYRRDRCG